MARSHLPARNAELAALFSHFADLLEVRGESPFKVNAYRRVAAGLAAAQEDVARLAAENRLRDLPGVGEAIERKIREYLQTGRIARYEEALAAVQPGVREMMRVPGLTPRQVARIVHALGVTDLPGLERAVREGRLRGVRGLGRLDAEAVLRGIAALRG